ncbi:MAG: hypothetical protein KIS92_07210 [Planctomycetota bacterium]|nr:hypothetical protein [Planctomycetota bacterium]
MAVDVRVRLDPHSAKAASGVPLPNPPPAAAAAPDGRSLGRSAMLLHALAYVFFLAALGMMLVLGEISEESQTVQGVGGAAAMTLSLWSLVISIRALFRAERPLLPVLNIAWVMIELVVPCMALWWPLVLNYKTCSELEAVAHALLLPVLIPCFVLGTFVAAPLAWWRVTRTFKRSEKARDWTRRQRWMHGARWYAAVMMLLSVLAGWPAMLLFSVYSARQGTNTVLSDAVIRVSPDFMKEWLCDASRVGRATFALPLVMAGYGCPSGTFLERLACDSDDQIADLAWARLKGTPQGMALARQMLERPHAYWACARWWAGCEFGAHAPSAEVEALLMSPGQERSAELDGIFRGILKRSDLELIPALVKLLDRKDPYHQHMAFWVLQFLKEGRMQWTLQQSFAPCYITPAGIPMTSSESQAIEALKAKLNADGR